MNNDEIVSKVMEIEENVQSIMAAANAQLEELPEEIHKQCAEIEEVLKKEYQKKIEAVRITVDREKEEKLNEIVMDKQKKQSEMDAIFEREHLQWEDELFQKIIGR